MASEGLKHWTTKSYMAGTRHFHVEEGLGDPFLPTLSRLHYVLRGVKWSEGEKGAMLWAACCLTFFGLFRACEFMSDSTRPRQTRYYTFYWQGVFCPVPGVSHAALCVSEGQIGWPLVPVPGW